jgi:Ca2+-binding RTX toxin-like protein
MLMLIDRLESRLLYSAGISLRQGVLYVHATDAAAVNVIVGYADAGKTSVKVTADAAQLGALLASSRIDRVILEGGAGNDSLKIDSTLARFDKQALILGSDGNDTLVGGAGDDALIGGAGDDILAGGKGNDLLCGGSGNDTLTGGTGNDICFGGLDSDQVDAGDGNDNIFSLHGPDTVVAGNGDDSITVGESGRSDGGAGNDDSSILAGSTAIVIGGADTNQSSSITAGKAARRLKGQVAAVADFYHLAKAALRQI